jgi:hypothetical protein
MNWTANELAKLGEEAVKITRKRTVRFLAGNERCDQISHEHFGAISQRMGRYGSQGAITYT